jgi:hypothetical protein
MKWKDLETRVLVGDKVAILLMVAYIQKLRKFIHATSKNEGMSWIFGKSNEFEDEFIEMYKHWEIMKANAKPETVYIEEKE